MYSYSGAGSGSGSGGGSAASKTRTAGGSLGGGSATAEATSAAGRAAEQRLAATSGGISAAKAAELDERRAKDDLIGKIRELCHRVGEDEPFGLPSASVDALKRHVTRLRGRVGGAGGAR